MNRKILLIFLFVFLIFLVKPVNALSVDEIKNRKECPVLELATAKEDESLEKVECYDVYEAAKTAMNNINNDNLVIIENGVIIDAKYALVDYDIDYPAGSRGYINVYNSQTDAGSIGYIRVTSGNPDDAAMIDYNYDSKRVKIKVAGLTGWIDKYDGDLKLYDIVPLIWVKKPQRYEVSGILVHVFPGNVYGTKTESSIKLDKKPEMLETGTYYSYDGHYFYRDLKTLLSDYKNNTYNNSVNKDKPYYNYYQYLSFRTKTSYSAENINDYLRNRVNSTSKMLDTGGAFIDVQNNYGVNAALMMSIGRNESGSGTSEIAKTKNNLFGLNAYDSSPGSASSYPTVADCISDYGYRWMSYWYLQPGDSHYSGANLGNKQEGLNVKYASDPFWGEKAASYYYDLDSFYSFQDRDSVQIGILNSDYSDTVYARKTPGGEKIQIYGLGTYYQYNKKDTPVAIVGEVEGPEVNGNTTWYKIMSEPTVDSNLNYIGDSKSNPRVLYDWNISFVYVPASYFFKANTLVGGYPSTPGETPTAKPISNIITEASYKYKDNIIYGIKPGEKIEDIKNKLTQTGGMITITDSNGNSVNSGNIGTGMKVNITSGNTLTLIVLIYGDVNGDGNISAVDYVKIKNHIMGTSLLTDVYLKAADVDLNNSITAVDYVNVKNYIMGNNNVINN